MWRAAAGVLALAAGHGLLGCLPDRMDAATLDAKVQQAQVAQVGCGNGKLEGNEQCDDKAANYCGGCADCQRRRAWTVNNDNALVVVPNTQVKSIDKVLAESKNGFSVEFWFRSDKLPVKTDKAGAVHTVVAISVLDAAGKSPAMTMSIARDGDKNAWYPVCVYSLPGPVVTQTVAAQGADPIQAGKWHHLRCALNDKSNKMQLRVDGGKVVESTTALTKLGAKPWFDPQTMGVVGAIPLHKDDPGQVFSGALDELRVVTGPHAYDFGPLKYRWVGDEPGTQILYHMDLEKTDRTLVDATANAAHAEQASMVSGKLLFSASALESQPDGCYGFSAAQAQCKVAAPWCGK